MSRRQLRTRGERFAPATLLAFVVAATFFVSTPAQKASGQQAYSSDDLSDTAELADPWGVTAARLADSLSISQDLARTYLDRGTRVHELYSALQSRGPRSFEDMYISYEPEYSLVILSTTGLTAEVSSFVRDEGLTDLQSLIQVKKIQYRTAVLVATIDEMTAAIPTVEFSAEADVVTQTVSFWPEAPKEAEQLRDVARTGSLPVPNSNIQIAALGLSTPTDNSFGGLNLDRQSNHAAECNSGFSVEQIDGTGGDGISTAGHCADNLEFSNGDDIDYQDGCDPLVTFCGDVDGQWSTTPGYDDRPWVRDGATTHRVIDSKTSRSNQIVGEYVCLSKRDDTVNCGFIQTKNFDPYGSGTNATFIRVNAGLNPYEPLAVGGDSGGPWWLGNANAYGIHSCTVNADPDDACYSAQNFLSQFDVRVKVA